MLPNQPALRIIGASFVTWGGKSLYYKGHLAPRHGPDRCFAGSTWARADVSPGTCHIAVTEGSHRVFRAFRGRPGNPCFSRACTARSGFALTLRARIGGETRGQEVVPPAPMWSGPRCRLDARLAPWASARRADCGGVARRPACRRRNGAKPAQCLIAPWRSAAAAQGPCRENPSAFILARPHV